MILVVDDHPVTLNAVAAMLRKRGHDARTAPSGHAALNILSATHPDLIVLDLCMPDIEGLHILRALRNDADYRHTPVIAFTASEDHAQAAMDIGANAAFIKGKVSWERFLQHIDRAVAA